MIKLLVGILKGAVIGGALGYGAYAIGDIPVLGNPWIYCGLIGAVVGMLVGKPIWKIIADKSATNVIAILKAVFGFGIGCGLYALIAKAWNPSFVVSSVYSGPLFSWPPTFGAAIGAVYGGFVELDDAIGDDGAKKPGSSKPSAAQKPAAKKQLPPTMDDE